MREFNTSGPNISSRHYTIERKQLISKGISLVEKERYKEQTENIDNVNISTYLISYDETKWE